MVVARGWDKGKTGHFYLMSKNGLCKIKTKCQYGTVHSLTILLRM
jgi:hypothetical protein